MLVAQSDEACLDPREGESLSLITRQKRRSAGSVPGAKGITGRSIHCSRRLPNNCMRRMNRLIKSR